MPQKIAIDGFSSTPKQVRTIKPFTKGLTNVIQPMSKLSHNHYSYVQLNIGKRMSEQFREYTKQRKNIDDIQGKSYFINHRQPDSRQKVLLLFNNLSAHKKIIYDSFVERLASSRMESSNHGTLIQAPVDFFVYNNNYSVFKSLLLNHIQGYTHYVIIPHFYEQREQAADLINQLPKHKLILLYKLINGVTGAYSSVVQSFENDLIEALARALPLLRKYTTLTLLFPEHTYHPKAILNVFLKFCYKHCFVANIIYNLSQLEIRSGDAYVNLIDDDIAFLLKKISNSTYQVGQDIGIISYNGTPFEQNLLNGITVISPDFIQMGRSAADIVLSDEPQHMENPFRLIVRNSL